MQFDWPRAYLHITRFCKTWFLQNHKLYDSVKTIKAIIMLHVTPKNGHMNGLNFL